MKWPELLLITYTISTAQSQLEPGSKSVPDTSTNSDHSEAGVADSGAVEAPDDGVHR